MGNLRDELLEGDFTTKRGFARLFLLTASIVIAGARGLGAPWEYGLIAVGIDAVVVTACWPAWYWWVRRIPKFKSNEIGILIAFNWSGPATDRAWVEGVLEALRQEFSARASRVRGDELQYTFVVRSLHRSVRIPDDRAGHEIVRDSQAAFMTWATVTAGNRGLTARVIKTCVRHRKLDPNRQALFTAALHEVWDGARPVKVDVATDTEDIGYAAKHLTVVATYQLGLAATASGALKLAEPLLREVVEGEATPKGYVRRARSELAAIAVAPWLLDEMYRPGIGPQDLDAAVQAARTGLAWDPNSVPALGLCATCAFLKRDLTLAKQTTNRLQSLAPDWYALNQAVFALDKGQYDTALVFYKRARKILRNNFDPHVGAMRWLKDAIDHLSPAYHFGLAYLLDYSSFQSEALTHYREAARLPLQPTSLRFVEARIADLAASEGRSTPSA